MIIDVKPEFGYEIACSIPYAYWLHKRGELEKVIWEKYQNLTKLKKTSKKIRDNIEAKIGDIIDA